ncbi:MAG: lactonase family protein, partial [Actinobacteria bacterium]|nr:lactonase family protein [Actinomycetota bacterium]
MDKARSVRRGAGPRGAVAFALSGLMLGAGSAGAVGELEQLGTPPRACISEDGTGGTCTDGHALDGAVVSASSPDGKSIYVASESSDAVVHFARNITTGELTEIGCVSEAGGVDGCVDGHHLDEPTGLVVSPDGRWLYVASTSSDAIVAFSRNTTTGVLTQAACLSADGLGCALESALVEPLLIAVSPNGRSVYVTTPEQGTSEPGKVLTFDRNLTTGALARSGCFSEGGSGGCDAGKAMRDPTGIAVSRDAKSVIVTSNVPSVVAPGDPAGSLVVFSRNLTTGRLTQSGCFSSPAPSGCTVAVGLDTASLPAISPDGKSVYVTSGSGDGALVTFARNTTTGALTQTQCLVETSIPGCVDSDRLAGVQGVTVSGDNKSVYVVSEPDGLINVFSRNTVDLSLTRTACISQSGGTCALGSGLAGAGFVIVSPNSRSVYVASSADDAVAAFSRNTTTGALTQLDMPPPACVSETGSGGLCSDGDGLLQAAHSVMSADGKFVYTTALEGDAVTTYSRNTTTGVLTQIACVSQSGAGECGTGIGLDGARGI